MSKKLFTPAEFLIENPRDTIDANEAIKQIDNNLRKGKLVTVFSGKDQVNPLGKHFEERIAIIKTEFQAVGWKVVVLNQGQGVTVTLSHRDIE